MTEGYVITWCSQNSEYDKTTGNVNYDVNNSKYLYDYGILASIYTDNNKQTSVFLVNYNTDKRHYTYGDQLNPVISIVNWDESNNTPKYVVAWDSPVRYEELTDGSYALLDTYEPNMTEYLEQEKIMVRYWPGTGNLSTSVNTIKLLAIGSDTVTGDRLSSENGSSGFYRPSSSVGSVWASAEESTASDASTSLTVAGTTGSDTLEIILAANGSLKSAKLNGETISADGYSSLIFNGQAGDDTVVFTGSEKDDSVVIYGDGGRISISGADFLFTASSIEDFQIDAKTGSDSLTVYTSKGSDKLTIGIGEMTLTSSSRFAVSAVGFEEVIARSTAGTDTAVLLDSKKDDELEISNTGARFVGGGAVNTVYGFSSVQAVSSNGGADTVALTDLTSLAAAASLVIASTDSSVNTVSGYNTVTASGNGTATATIVGSRRSDHFESSATDAAFTYYGGKTVEMSGFSTINVNGNGGADTATLTGGAGVNTFTGRSGSAAFSNGTFTRNLTGFSDVSVGRRSEDDPATYKAVFYDSVGNDSLTADGDTATMSFGNTELYSVIAFDQVTAKKEKYTGTDTVKVSNPIDFVLENDGWKTL